MNTLLSYLDKMANNMYVSGSSVYNYLTNDPLHDYLKQRQNISTGNYQNLFLDFILQQGINFEEKVITYLRNMRKLNIVSVGGYYSAENLERTLNLMKAGTPFIHGAHLCSNSKKVYGIADLLIRSDIFTQLTSTNPEEINEEYKVASHDSNFSPDWHYVVVDIKFSTLPLSANGKNLLNTDGYPAYKGQLCIYSWCLEEIQGYFPPQAYILGRRYSYTSKSVKISADTCDEKLGVIDYIGIDKEYLLRTEQAIKWIREVRTNWHTFSLAPPSRDELYPNMSSNSKSWWSVKEQLAKEIGELTMIWNVGVKARNKALQNGIKSWHNCTAEQLGFKNGIADSINAIIKVNSPNSNIAVIPEEISFNIPELKKNEKEYFVDFETIPDIFHITVPKSEKTEMIFMIGVGYFIDQQWQYKSFVAKALTSDEEVRIFTEWRQWISEQAVNVMWHWSGAEPQMLKRAIIRNPSLAIDTTTFEHVWQDLAQIYITEPVAIRGCFDYSLKNITKSIYGLNNQSSPYDGSKCKNGLDASVLAYQEYTNGNDHSIIHEIVKYNETDCKAVSTALEFLRERLPSVKRNLTNDILPLSKRPC
jgi:hypothetical protein